MNTKMINSIKELLSKFPTSTFSTRYFALITLLVLGILGNYWHLSLLFGIDFIFGSIAVFMVVELYGIFWGVLAGIIASSFTFLIWGHPYAIIIFTCEIVFVSLLKKRLGYNLLLVDEIYWLCLGMPLIFLFYRVEMQVETSEVLLILFERPVNGIFNVLVASLLLSYSPLFVTFSGIEFSRNFLIKESFVNLLVLFAFFPSLILILILVKNNAEFSFFIYINALITILLTVILATVSGIILSNKLLELIEILAVTNRERPNNLLRQEKFKMPDKLAPVNPQLNLEIYERKKLNNILENRVKERTAELENSLAQLQGLICNLKGGILVENPRGYITLINQDFCNFFALSSPPQNFMGILSVDVAREAKKLFLNPDEFVTKIAEILRQKKPVVNEELKLHDGRTLERDYIPITFSGKFYGHLWLYRDISARKQIEIEIKTALAKETELNQLKSRFISMTSHEFRTPLTVISSSVGILKTFAARLSDHKKLEHLDRIETYVKHTTKLLDEILLLNQAEAGKLQLKPQLIDLACFCEQLVNEIQVSAPDRNLVFTHNSTGETSKATIDEKLLRQVLINLLCNAIKYSPDGEEINFTLTFTRDRYIFQVKDRGIGIPPEDQKHLFEFFHRATNVGGIQGTGLGLSIVQKCVELHGGDVKVESELGKGTTFTVTLPLTPTIAKAM